MLLTLDTWAIEITLHAQQTCSSTQQRICRKAHASCSHSCSDCHADSGPLMQHGHACSVLELRQRQGGNDGRDDGLDSAKPCQHVAFCPIAGRLPLMQLTFVQPLLVKRGVLRRAVPAEAVVEVQLAACSHGGRTYVMLQHARAWLRREPSSALLRQPPASRSAALVDCGAVLQGATLQFSARTKPAQGRSPAVWRRFSTFNPPKDGIRMVSSARACDSHQPCR